MNSIYICNTNSDIISHISLNNIYVQNIIAKISLFRKSVMHIHLIAAEQVYLETLVVNYKQCTQL